MNCDITDITYYDIHTNLSLMLHKIAQASLLKIWNWLFYNTCRLVNTDRNRLAKLDSIIYNVNLLGDLYVLYRTDTQNVWAMNLIMIHTCTWKIWQVYFVTRIL